MHKSAIVHLKNKYPDAVVQASESSVDVYQGGDHKVALRKNGAGQWVDQSEALGASDRFDLSPIPKESRVFKVCPKGNIVKDEKAAEREKAREKYMRDGKVLSCEELGGKEKFHADGSEK